MYIYIYRYIIVALHMLGTVPTKNVHVPVNTCTVTDSGSAKTGLLGTIGRYIYRNGRL